MISLETIKRELFVKDCVLLNTTNPKMFGVPSSNDTICYYQNEYGYVFYLPNVQLGFGSKSLFDPQSPVSFRWTLFNKQIIFVPLTKMPYKTMVNLHPDPSVIPDVIVRFNFEYHNRFEHCFVDAQNPEEDYYFILRYSKKNSSETVISEIRDNFCSVMPEFLRSNIINVVINENNIDELWRHWLAVECHMKVDTYNFRKYYHNSFNDQEWIDGIVSELIFKNLTMKKEQPSIDKLDIGLQKLLGYIK